MANENELRDYHGRWTAGGENAPPPPAPSPERWAALGVGDQTMQVVSGLTGGAFVAVLNPDHVEDARRIGLAASAVARELDFDPAKINVTDQELVFELGNTNHTYAGVADLQRGFITLYTGHLAPASVPGVVAHEIMHQKWEAYTKDYRAESDKVMSDPDAKDKPYRGAEAFMHPDGTLGPKYAERYPVYQEYTKLMMNSEKMRNEDGCSEYSREWWNAYKSPNNSVERSYINVQGNEQKYTTGKVTQDQAYHETLAEMARLDYERRHAGIPPDKVKGNSPGPPAQKTDGTFSKTRYSTDWLDLYNAVNRHWKARQS